MAKGRRGPNKKTGPKPKKADRPGPESRYNERIVARILELARAGNSNAEIANKVGISPVTLWNWMGKHPDFSEALKMSKDFAVDMVEGALFQNAMGYSHPAVKMFYDGKAGKVVTQAFVERHKPDTIAQIFFLKNRAKDRWRDKLDHEVAGKDGGPIEHAVEQRRRLFVDVVASPETADLAEQLAMQLAQKRLAQANDAELGSSDVENDEAQADPG